MRLRHVKDGDKILAAHDKVIQKPESYKGNWKKQFKDSEAPLHVEFGSGRGAFIIGMANQHPEINYLAFERNAKVVVKGLSYLDDNPDDNFYLVHADITSVLDIFEEGEVDRMYLNFSDPWPKKRHAKRRLTHKRFLDNYAKILVKGGELHFKTDNDGLFDFSLEELEENGWELLLVERDLHNSEHVEGNIMTEYEAKFSSRGKNINKLIAKSPRR